MSNTPHAEERLAQLDALFETVKTAAIGAAAR
jgi:hypothetical protein